MRKMYEKELDEAVEKYRKILLQQLKRADALRDNAGAADFQSKEKIIIGIVGGDGIGPEITAASQRILEFLLKDDDRVSFLSIEGLTLENRIAKLQSIPDDVLAELKKCDVILKGPTTTPQAGDGLPNIESANVRMRKELDLYANIRPVSVPEKDIDWTFFRENTEGAYALGSDGYHVNSEVAIDFTVTTTEGTRRIAKIAYEYAKNNRKDRVSLITKANVIKTTDGKFLEICHDVAKDYPGITTDEWYIDILSAKLIDEKRRTSFKVFVLPNLYGDIITDEAAEFQGGVGTAGSANIGDRYAMFEAIHGSAPRMVQEGRAAYADPSSIMRAAVMLLSHIGRQEQADLFSKALDKCLYTEKKLTITGRDTGATCAAFTEYVMDTVKSLTK